MKRKTVVITLSLLIISVLLSECCGTELSSINGTEVGSSEEQDAADAVLERMNFAEFKERYRRLIPYMSYFGANNYVNSQVSGASKARQAYDRETQTSGLIRKPQRLVPLGRGGVDGGHKSNGHHAGLNGAKSGLYKQEVKFVPSVQYDPKDVDANADYFAPVVFNPKLNYDNPSPKLNYDRTEFAPPSRQYLEYGQQRPLAHPTGILNPQQANYYLNDRQSYDSSYDRKRLLQKPRVVDPDTFILDYGAKISNNDPHVPPPASGKFGYPLDHSKPHLSYVTVATPVRYQAKPTTILAQTAPRRPVLLQSPPPPSSLNPARKNPSSQLNDVIKSLHLTTRLPEMLNKNNIDSSLRTLVEILNILNNGRGGSEIGIGPNYSARENVPAERLRPGQTRPRVVTENNFQATPRPRIVAEESPIRDYPEVVYEANARFKTPPGPNYEVVGSPKFENAVEYYAPYAQNVNGKIIQGVKSTESRPIDLPGPIEADFYVPLNRNAGTKKVQGFESTEGPAELPIDDYYEGNEADSDTLEDEGLKKIAIPTADIPVSKFESPDLGNMHQALVPPTLVNNGATRGKPNVDYPAHAAIPETKFNCKEQRYKGFFGDPSTGCQVWHYCDLNGGKSSFLCPNGTIFSQVALTCDWWFNVKCESTTQLYVLNERLYKYILPVIPKFPEDFSGPEVDRYLELKFKEMEAKLKEKKLKKQQEKDKIKEKLQGLDNEK